MAKFASLAFLCFGILLMILALKESWFTLPIAPSPEAPAHVRDATVTRSFKIGLAISLLIGGCGALLTWNRHGWISLWGWLFLWSVAVFPLIWWYPQWVIVQEAETSGNAAWLQQQHDNLTWLGGDVFRAHPERYNEIQLSVNMQDPPAFLAAFRTPMDTLTSLGIEEIPEIIWWFGLNPAFSQFVARGWFFAWLGAAMIGIGAFGLLKGKTKHGTVLIKGRHRFVKLRHRLLKASFYVLCVSCSILIGSALIPVLSASKNLRVAKNAAVEGHYQSCLNGITSAQKWMPALLFDTSLILQQGRIETLLGNSTPHARLYQIWKLESDGYGGRAKELLADLEKERAQLPRELSRELSRAWMRVTTDDFNSGRVMQAYEQFGNLCEIEPVAIQARFHHQLTCLQLGDIENNRRRHAEIQELYEPYLRKNKRGVLATSWLILSQGEWNAGHPRAAAEARRNSKGL